LEDEDAVWLVDLGLSPTPDEDALRIEQQIEQVCAAEALVSTMCGSRSTISPGKASITMRCCSRQR